jgi:predicted nucleic acid-binding protein
MIFVDTGPWFAAAVPNDPRHRAIRDWMDANRLPLVTTDYVIDELLTLLRARRESERALLVGEALLSGAAARLEWVTPDDIRAAWTVYRDFGDKEWSFTDCVSRVVMSRLGVATALTFDHHFRQFGTITVVPG